MDIGKKDKVLLERPEIQMRVDLDIRAQLSIHVTLLLQDFLNKVTLVIVRCDYSDLIRSDARPHEYSDYFQDIMRFYPVLV